VHDGIDCPAEIYCSKGRKDEDVNIKRLVNDHNHSRKSPIELLDMLKFEDIPKNILEEGYKQFTDGYDPKEVFDLLQARMPKWYMSFERFFIFSSEDVLKSCQFENILRNYFYRKNEKEAEKFSHDGFLSRAQAEWGDLEFRVSNDTTNGKSDIFVTKKNMINQCK